MFQPLSPLKPRKKKNAVSLCLMQRRLERFSDARLDRAMQKAWNKEYDPKEFFSVALPTTADAIIHAFGTEIAIHHCDYPVDWLRLGEEPLPFWAQHSSHTVLDYRWDEDPDYPTRFRLYRGLGMLAAELSSPDTAAFYFPHEDVLLPNSDRVAKALRGRGPLNPMDLEPLADE